MGWVPACDFGKFASAKVNFPELAQEARTDRGPMCLSGCGKPTWNNQPGYCSVDCQRGTIAQRAMCVNGCGKFTWNNQPGYCSIDCKSDWETRLPMCLNGCGKPSWDNQPGYCSV